MTFFRLAKFSLWFVSEISGRTSYYVVTISNRITSVCWGSRGLSLLRHRPSNISLTLREYLNSQIRDFLCFDSTNNVLVIVSSLVKVIKSRETCIDKDDRNFEKQMSSNYGEGSLNHLKGNFEMKISQLLRWNVTSKLLIIFCRNCFLSFFSTLNL